MMFPFFRKKKQLRIGVDVSDEVVSIMQLSLEGSSYCVTGYVSAALPVGAVVEREIKDVQLVGAIIRDLVKKRKWQGDEVVIGLPRHVVMTQVIPLQKELSDAEISEHMDNNLSRYVSIPTDEINFDFTVLGENKCNSDLRDFLLVVCRSQSVNSVIELADVARLQLKAIDIETLVMERVINQMTSLLYENEKNKTIALMEVASKKLTLYVVDNQKLMYTRDHFINDAHMSALDHMNNGLQLFKSSTGFQTIDTIILSNNHYAQEKQLEKRLGSSIGTVELLKNVLPASLAKEAPQTVDSLDLIRCYGLALRGFMS